MEIICNWKVKSIVVREEIVVRFGNKLMIIVFLVVIMY